MNQIIRLLEELTKYIKKLAYTVVKKIEKSQNTSKTAF